MPSCLSAVVDDLTVQQEAPNSLPVIRSYEERRVVDVGTGALRADMDRLHVKMGTLPVHTGGAPVALGLVAGHGINHDTWTAGALPLFDYNAFTLFDWSLNTTAVNELHRQAPMMAIFGNYLPTASSAPAPRRLENDEHKVLD